MTRKLKAGVTEAEVRSHFLAYQPFATTLYLIQVALLAKATADHYRAQQLLHNLRHLIDDTLQLLQDHPHIPR